MTRVYLYKRLEVNRYHGCLDVLQLDRESWFFFQKKFFSSKSHLERKKEKKVPSNPENLDLVLGLIPWSTGPRQDRTEHSSARPHKLLHQAAQIPAHPSFTHPSRFRASEASGDRRQPAAPPPPLPRALDKEERYASGSRAERIAPPDWRLLIVCRQCPRPICSAEVSAAVHSPWSSPLRIWRGRMMFVMRSV